jgi:hypothetical protein
VTENYLSLLEIKSLCLLDLENQPGWTDSESQVLNKGNSSKIMEEREVRLNTGEKREAGLVQKGLDYAKKIIGNVWDAKKA